MKASPHSPAPWQAIEGRINSDSRYVATVDDWSNPHCADQYQEINRALKTEAEANAALIAQAPALAEALNECAEFLLNPHVREMLDRSGAFSTEYGRAVVNARAALSAAGFTD